MKINPKIPILSLALLSAGIAPQAMINVNLSNKQNYDTFEYITPVKQSTNSVQNRIIPEGGTTDAKFMSKAPNPHIVIAGEDKTAVIVVSIKDNLLFKYNKQGKVERVYSVATGKPSTPTKPQVCIVTHKEKHPYRGAPKTTQRWQTPNAFGDYCVCMEIIDTKTGKQRKTGQFLHGTNKPESVGHKASKGCMRMFKKDITTIKDQVNRGDIIIVAEDCKN